MRPKKIPKHLIGLLNYDERSPTCLVWSSSNANNIKAGRVAGAVKKDGYVAVGFNGSYYKAHRIVWAMHHKDWDELGMIDHINRIKGDNRLVNLRIASMSQNIMNRPEKAGSVSGLKGVVIHRGRYRASIQVSGKCKHLGYFSDPIEAADAYDVAAEKASGGYAMLNRDCIAYAALKAEALARG